MHDCYDGDCDDDNEADTRSENDNNEDDEITVEALTGRLVPVVVQQ